MSIWTELLERLGQLAGTNVVSLAIGELLGPARIAAVVAVAGRLLRGRRESFDDVAEHEEATNPFGSLQPSETAGVKSKV